MVRERAATTTIAAPQQIEIRLTEEPDVEDIDSVDLLSNVAHHDIENPVQRVQSLRPVPDLDSPRNMQRRPIVLQSH